MKTFWKPRREDNVERLLRANRPEPRHEFVSSLLERIGTPRHRLSSPRMARGVLAAAAVTALAVGVGVAAGATHVASTSISNLVHVGQSSGNSNTANTNGQDNNSNGTDNNSNGNDSAGDQQYMVGVCHHTGSKKNPWVEIFVSPQGAANLVKHHPPDFIVDSTHPCPP